MSELKPSDEADGEWTPRGAIPPPLRSFGKFPNTANWWPGDLMLTKDLAPDWSTRAITNAQIKGGYARTDSAWTHAAVYLGDGQNVCEATFTSPLRGGSVQVNPLWNYCGGYALRIRRSLFVQDKELGWRMVIYALTHLKKDYDFFYAIRLGWQALRGRGFWQTDVTARINPRALICSTLYADAHNKATQRVLGEVSRTLRTGLLKSV